MQDFEPGVLIDVAANIGLFCVRLRGLWPEARIIAHETMPRAFVALQQK